MSIRVSYTFRQWLQSSREQKLPWAIRLYLRREFMSGCSVRHVARILEIEVALLQNVKVTASVWDTHKA